MYQDSSEQAAHYLREAVPLMVRHRIPPTPFNYALWYCYVSNRDPRLNRALDSTLATHGTCPTFAAETLFRDHIIPDQIAAGGSARQSLQAIVQELLQQVDDALQGAEGFHELLDTTSQSLEAGVDAGDLQSLVKSLAQGTRLVSRSTRVFQARINQAQAEIDALKAELEQSRDAAQRDALTGLHNRRGFEQRATALEDADPEQSYSLILLDIDHFKRFNDSYGHLVGDQVLKCLADLLRQEVGAGELGVRFGGEEFALLLRGDGDATVGRADELRRKVNAIVLKPRGGGKPISRITASFGIADRVMGQSLECWLERTDRALYRAKAEGRNRVVRSTD